MSQPLALFQVTSVLRFLDFISRTVNIQKLF